ncbi:MAG: hypothetical protein GC161_14495 [Planctomycetaceae bacterium]|nr:hypothetical protein [Planctomycetaceae bacterium]
MHLASLPRRGLLLATAGSLFALPTVAASQVGEGTDAPRLVLLLRHGEKGEGDKRDPPLSEVGLARAKALAELLAPARPALIAASEYRRTQDTVGPLAKAVGAEVQVLPAREPERWLAAVDALPPGSVAVLCGHSNTVPELCKRMGVELVDLEKGPAGPQFAEHVHHRLVCVVRGAAAPVHFELSLGEAAPVEAPSGG